MMLFRKRSDRVLPDLLLLVILLPSGGIGAVDDPLFPLQEKKQLPGPAVSEPAKPAVQNRGELPEQQKPVTNTQTEPSGQKKEVRSIKERLFANPFTPFPTLHPLIIHFPIVLLALAPLLQLIGIFRKSLELHFAIIALLLLALVTALLAITMFHPETTGLPAATRELLERHGLFAGITIGVTVSALLLKLFSLLKRFLNPVIELIALVLITGACLSVAITGHFGATLTHIDGVGPQGRYLQGGQTQSPSSFP